MFKKSFFFIVGALMSLKLFVCKAQADVQAPVDSCNKNQECILERLQQQSKAGNYVAQALLVEYEDKLLEYDLQKDNHRPSHFISWLEELPVRDAKGQVDLEATREQQLSLIVAYYKGYGVDQDKAKACDYYYDFMSDQLPFDEKLFKKDKASWCEDLSEFLFIFESFLNEFVSQTKEDFPEKDFRDIMKLVEDEEYVLKHFSALSAFVYKEMTALLLKKLANQSSIEYEKRWFIEKQK